MKRALRVRAALALLIFALVSIGFVPAASASGDYSTQELIFDEANVLDDRTVVGYLNGLDLPEGSRVAVLASDASSLRKDTFDADVLDYIVSKKNPDLLDESMTGLESKTFLVVISPKIRKLGLYGSDDSGISSGMVEAATSAMKPSARAGDWNRVPSDGMKAAGQWWDDHRPLTPQEQAAADAEQARQQAEADAAAERAAASFVSFIKWFVGIIATAAAAVASFFGGRAWLRRRKLLAWKGPDAVEATNALAEWQRATAMLDERGVDSSDFDEPHDLLTDLAGRQYLATVSERLDPDFRVRVADAIAGAPSAVADAQKLVAKIEANVNQMLDKVEGARSTWAQVEVLNKEAAENFGANGVTVASAQSTLRQIEGMSPEAARAALVASPQLRKNLSQVIQSASAALAGAISQSDFILARGTWKDQWDEYYSDRIKSPLRQAQASLSGLAEHLSKSELASARSIISSVEAEAKQVDADVRKRRINPPAGKIMLDRVASELKSSIAAESKNLSAQMKSSLSTSQARSYAKQHKGSSDPYSFDVSTAVLLWAMLPSDTPSYSASSSGSSFSSSSSSSSSSSYSSFGGFSGGSSGFDSGGGGFSGGSSDF